MQKIEIKCKGADLLPVDTIKDFQGKLKRISRDNLERLKRSILKNGFVAPIFIWCNKGQSMALDGHQRIKALLSMREEGYDIPLLPVAYIEADNEDDARQKLLAITSQYGEFDIDELSSWVSNLDEEIAETLRFVDDKIELDIEEIETEGDDEFKDEIGPITQLGDLWELGQHYILCGDAETDKYKLINQKIDLLFTDPPYGINVVSRNIIEGDGPLNFGNVGYSNIVKTIKYKKVYGDDKEFNPEHLLNKAKKIILFGANYYANKLPNSAGWLIWDKNGGKQWKDTFADAELLWSNFKHHVRTYYCMWKGLVKEGESGKRMHPTQKPIKLLTEILLDYSEKNNIIYDPYIGSGSTLIACEKTNRICYGMEIEPYYCDIIANRYRDWCIKNEREHIIKLNGESWQ